MNLDLEILKEIVLWEFQTKVDDKLHNGWTDTEFNPPSRLGSLPESLSYQLKQQGYRFVI